MPSLGIHWKPSGGNEVGFVCLMSAWKRGLRAVNPFLPSARKHARVQGGGEQARVSRKDRQSFVDANVCIFVVQFHGTSWGSYGARHEVDQLVRKLAPSSPGVVYPTKRRRELPALVFGMLGWVYAVPPYIFHALSLSCRDLTCHAMWTKRRVAILRWDQSNLRGAGGYDRCCRFSLSGAKASRLRKQPRGQRGWENLSDLHEMQNDVCNGVS